MDTPIGLDFCGPHTAITPTNPDGAYVDVAAPVDNVPTVAYDANPTPPSMRTPAETKPDSWPHIHATKNLEIFGRYL